MEIKITLHGILRDYLPKKAKGQTTLTVPEGTTINNIIEQLKIKQTVSAVVNDTETENNHILQNGDELQMFRLIAGG